MTTSTIPSMSAFDWISATSVVVGVVTTAVAVLEHRRATRTEARAQRAEAELELARNRVAGPWFEIAKVRNRPLLVSTYRLRRCEGLGIPRQCKLMGEMREVPKGTLHGTPVLLVVEDIGKAVSRLEDPILDGERILLQRESAITSEPNPIMKAASNTEAAGWPLWWFEYPYKAEKHGARQKLTLKFIDSGGFERTHVYELTHGLAELRRIEPPG